MPKFDVQELVAPLLAQGEEVLGWARVNYSGQTEPPALRRTGIVALGEPLIEWRSSYDNHAA